jgi:hypothetical protein
MLRVYFLQQLFNLSDPGAEDALYESPVLRHFVGVDLGRAPVPDESTILGFRHLLEKHELGEGDAERGEPVSRTGAGGPIHPVLVAAVKTGCYKYSAGACMSGATHGMCGATTAEVIVTDGN